LACGNYACLGIAIPLPTLEINDVASTAFLLEGSTSVSFWMLIPLVFAGGYLLGPMQVRATGVMSKPGFK
jgi:hypothetical protein